MVPKTFRFIIPLTWCRRWLITSSWNLSTNVSWYHQHFELFQDINRNHDERYHPYPLIIWVIIDNIIAFPPTQNLFLICVVPWVPCYPTYDMFYRGVLPYLMSRRLWGLLDHLRILAIMILLIITILSWSACWFQPGYPQVNDGVWILHF